MIGSKKNLPFSVKVRRKLVEPDNEQISAARQCQLLGLNRTGIYYRARAESVEDGELMRLNGRAIYDHAVLRLPANDSLFTKHEWLAPEDYTCREQLKYSVKQALSAFGKSLRIKFAEFKTT